MDVSYVTEFTEDDVVSRQYSILDLCALQSFTLLVGNSSSWNERFKNLEQMAAQAGIKLRMYAADTDFEFVFDNQYQLFGNGAGFAHGGGLLVRPDQHILTRAAADTSAEYLWDELRRHLSV